MKIKFLVTMIAINIVTTVYAVRYEEPTVKYVKPIQAKAVARTLRHYHRHGMSDDLYRAIKKVDNLAKEVNVALEKQNELASCNAHLAETNTALAVENAELKTKYGVLLGVMKSLCPIDQIPDFNDGSMSFTTTRTATVTTEFVKTTTTTTTTCHVSPLSLS